jgi:hypothetical protein
MSNKNPPVTVRPALPGDRPALARLAALDSSGVPAGRLLVAEVGGQLWAAVPVGGGRAIADPFRPSADVVALLELRARHLRDGRPGARRRPSRLLLRTMRA